MKKLRIAFVVDMFPCISETFILNQIIDLIDRGHEVDIYAKKGEWGLVHKKVKEYNLHEKISYLQIPENKLQRLAYAMRVFYRGGWKSFTYLKTLNVFTYGKQALNLHTFLTYTRYAGKPEYAIIHAHFGHNGALLAQMKAEGFLKKTALVTTFHGYDINPQKIDSYKRSYRSLFLRGDLCTVNSDFTGHLLLAAGCPKEKIIRLPVGLDTSFYKPKKAASSKKDGIVRILFCGRLIPFKAPDLVVRIAHKLIFEKKKVNIRFYIVGDGVLKDSLRELIEEYALSGYVDVMGSKTQEEIIDIMSEMDIFLYPGIVDKASGRAENQGLVLQEAQAMRLPVVASNVGGIPEGILDNTTGFLVEEGNLELFASKLELLINDEELRLRMGAAGRNYVVANYDSKVLGDVLEENYYQHTKKIS